MMSIRRNTGLLLGVVISAFAATGSSGGEMVYSIASPPPPPALQSPAPVLTRSIASRALRCPAPAGVVSMNTTGQGYLVNPYPPLAEQAFAGDGAHRLLASNDLGMHCMDLDIRVASILPPYNVVHAQVVTIGATPQLLTNAQANVSYSSSYNPSDPVLANAPVYAPDGSVYKSDWGPLAINMYGSLYPTAAPLASFLPTVASRIGDLGLPVPDLELLYPNSGASQLFLRQQTMPSMRTSVFGGPIGQPTQIVDRPYQLNGSQPFRHFETNFPFFKTFAFGYQAPSVNWYTAEGIPITPFDDVGRENPFSLMRVQAKDPATAKTMASLDVVVPVAAEMNCKSCHLPSPYGNGMATARVVNPIIPPNDPKVGHVLQWVTEEWASKVNILKLHDVMHGTTLFQGYNKVTGVAKNPVLCQSCHYSPALDLAQLGPTTGHGLNQTTNATMSHVMHFGHGSLMVNGAPVFPTMAAPNDPLRTAGRGPNDPINAYTQAALSATCYQCHPGNRVQCLRGKMFSSGVVCQDCHGQMKQVGDDFSRDVPNGGAFIVRSDFYTNPATPRVPWMNEPTCGSCHTGDAVSNMTTKPGAIPDADGIRLEAAYLTTDPKATPIVPTNTRFAEPVVASGPTAGNPQLFRLSTGHGGVFCEGCHGATHAEWPVANPAANDNLAANQMQTHSGKLLECDSCHTGTLGTTLAGPHGMHPVGDKGYSSQWVSAHGGFVDRGGTAQCATCHGVKGVGSVLAVTSVPRVNLPCDSGPLCKNGRITLAAGTTVTCTLCHGTPFARVRKAEAAPPVKWGLSWLETPDFGATPRSRTGRAGGG